MLTILAVRYLEPYGEKIIDLCKATGYAVKVIDRDPAGIGSLAEAINRGIEKVKTEYTWIVTNNTFEFDAPTKLLNAINETGAAAIHPVFNSDHLHQRPNGTDDVVLNVPYIEFTSPIVRTNAMLVTPLDETMAYWGHDLDWGYRARQAGLVIGVHHGVKIEHVYIRDQADHHEITTKRWQARCKSNDITKRQLRAKYGSNWRTVLGYFG